MTHFVSWSAIPPYSVFDLAMFHCLTGVEDGHRRGLVPAQSPKLCVGQIGVGTFRIAAMAQTHELDLGVDAGGGTYRRLLA